MSFPSPLRLLRSVKQLGWRESAWRFFKTRELVYLLGKEVGKDTLGNTYYELAPEDAVYGRDRVVWYANPDFDASQVPPEWHQWLHRMTDRLPTRAAVDALTPKYVREHSPNMTGTGKAYSPKSFIGNEEWTGHARGPVRAWTPSAATDAAAPIKKEDL